jgi:hypothetical protein
MEPLNYFVAQNVSLLHQGLELLENMTDTVYCCNGHMCFSSGIGRHFRHILDLYRCLVEMDGNRVDYDARQRNADIESDRLVAISTAKEMVAALEEMAKQQVGLDPEIEVSSNEGRNEGNISPWCRSSLVRELQYLASHTIHHYALIAMIFRLQDGAPPDEFGVAPSTLLFEGRLS